MTPFLSEIIKNTIKSREHISLFTVNGVPLFFQHFDGPFYPTLKLLHKCTYIPLFFLERDLPASDIAPIDPFLLPQTTVDRGAIRFLLGGAHMMCPGFTSAGGRLPPPEEALPVGAPVAIMAEGKEHAVGIGITKLSTEEIKAVNKGVGVETVSYLGDDLWNVNTL